MNRESKIEDFFRIKYAGSSNYRGSVFLLPEFTPGVCLLAFLPGATFSPPAIRRQILKSQKAQIKRRLRRRVVLNLGHFDFEIVSDFDISISDFKLPDNSLCNNMLTST